MKSGGFFRWTDGDVEAELHYGDKVLGIAFRDTDGGWTWVVTLDHIAHGTCPTMQAAKDAIVNEVCS